MTPRISWSNPSTKKLSDNTILWHEQLYHSYMGTCMEGSPWLKISDEWQCAPLSMLPTDDNDDICHLDLPPQTWSKTLCGPCFLLHCWLICQPMDCVYYPFWSHRLVCNTSQKINIFRFLFIINLKVKTQGVTWRRERKKNFPFLQMIMHEVPDRAVMNDYWKGLACGRGTGYSLSFGSQNASPQSQMLPTIFGLNIQGYTFLRS